MSGILLAFAVSAILWALIPKPSLVYMLHQRAKIGVFQKPFGKKGETRSWFDGNPPE